jgi:hypothetical protein
MMVPMVGSGEICVWREYVARRWILCWCVCVNCVTVHHIWVHSRQLWREC